MCGHSDLLLVLLKPSSTIILCPGRGRKRAGCPQATHKQCGEDKAFITQLHKGSVSALPGYIYLYPRCQFCKLALFLKILCKQKSFEYFISSESHMETSVSFFPFCGVSKGFHCLSFYFSWSIVTDEKTRQGLGSIQNSFCRILSHLIGPCCLKSNSGA